MAVELAGKRRGKNWMEHDEHTSKQPPGPSAEETSFAVQSLRTYW
jgi:hypothetical protein